MEAEPELVRGAPLHKRSHRGDRAGGLHAEGCTKEPRHVDACASQGSLLYGLARSTFGVSASEAARYLPVDDEHEEMVNLLNDEVSRAWICHRVMEAMMKAKLGGDLRLLKEPSLPASEKWFFVFPPDEACQECLLQGGFSRKIDGEAHHRHANDEGVVRGSWVKVDA